MLYNVVRGGYTILDGWGCHDLDDHTSVLWVFWTKLPATVKIYFECVWQTFQSNFVAGIMVPIKHAVSIDNRSEL